MWAWCNWQRAKVKRINKGGLIVHRRTQEFRTGKKGRHWVLFYTFSNAKLRELWSEARHKPEQVHKLAYSPTTTSFHGCAESAVSILNKPIITSLWQALFHWFIEESGPLTHTTKKALNIHQTLSWWEGGVWAWDWQRELWVLYQALLLHVAQVSTVSCRWS